MVEALVMALRNHVFVTVWACAGILGGVCTPAFARAIPVDGYAAVVNDRVIAVGDVLAAMEPVREQLQIVCEGEELERRLNEAYQTTLQSLIERALIAEEFKAKGGELPDRIVDDYLNQIVSERFTNRVALLKSLQAQRMTWEDWRRDMRDRLIASQLRQQEVTSRVVVTPQQEREAYEKNIARYQMPEEVWIRLIGLQKGVGAEEREVKKAEAERLRERIAAGEDFDALARAESEGPKASEGGDLGWRKPSDFAAPLSDAIKKLEPGQVSPVIETDEMFFIIKLEARKNSAQIPLSEVRAQIHQELRKQEEERLYKIWIEQLRNRHYVKIFRERLSM
jgi:peptidyl-prolyl cis-trans isomerase SurA